MPRFIKLHRFKETCIVDKESISHIYVTRIPDNPVEEYKTCIVFKDVAIEYGGDLGRWADNIITRNVLWVDETPDEIWAMLN